MGGGSRGWSLKQVARGDRRRRRARASTLTASPPTSSQMAAAAATMTMAKPGNSTPTTNSNHPKLQLQLTNHSKLLALNERPKHTGAARSAGLTGGWLGGWRGGRAGSEKRIRETHAAASRARTHLNSCPPAPRDALACGGGDGGSNQGACTKAGTPAATHPLLTHSQKA